MEQSGLGYQYKFWPHQPRDNCWNTRQHVFTDRANNCLCRIWEVSQWLNRSLVQIFGQLTLNLPQGVQEQSKPNPRSVLKKHTMTSHCFRCLVYPRRFSPSGRNGLCWWCSIPITLYCVFNGEKYGSKNVSGLTLGKASSYYDISNIHVPEVFPLSDLLKLQ